MQPDNILQKAAAGQSLNYHDILSLLSLTAETDQAKVFAAARAMRTRHFQNKIFLYGFVYFSTHCRNNCSFCYYRRNNNESPRYRKDLAETVRIAGELAASGVHLIDLTMGEDPFFHKTGNEHRLIEMIRAVKDSTNLPVMVSPGLLPTRSLYNMKKAGADWYALYQETHNRHLYGKLRLEQNYDNRMTAKNQAKKLGLMIEEGILLGIGESPGDVAHSILSMRELGVHQARVMSLVPQRGTPLAGYSSPPEIREQLTIATMRLALGNVLIPASLDIEGITGLKNRLKAGANVVTSIIPPRTGLAGVSQSSLDIEEGFRTVAGAIEVLTGLNLVAADGCDYVNWLQSKKTSEPPITTRLAKGGNNDETGHYRRTASGN